MDADAQKLLAAGQALARSIGHAYNCPKASTAVPCICESKQQQAKALDDWIHLVAEINAENKR